MTEDELDALEEKAYWERKHAMHESVNKYSGEERRSGKERRDGYVADRKQTILYSSKNEVITKPEQRRQYDRRGQKTAEELDIFVKQKYKELGHLPNGNILIARSVINFLNTPKDRE